MKGINLNIVLLVSIMLCHLSCQREFLDALNETEIRIDESSTAHPYQLEAQAIIDKYTAKGLPGVSIVIDSPDDGILRCVSGYAKLENQTPMETHHVFNSGSVAKTYHVVAALMLMEEGLLDIEQTIDTYLPAWVCNDLPNGKSATVKQLMNHSSGIPDYIEHIDHILDYFHDLRKEFTQDEFLNYICGTKANFEPGTSGSYSNTNTVLLALIMDEITGNHADIITQKIINKLDLKQTFYKNESGYPAPAGGVQTYVDLKSNGEIINSTEIQRHFDKVTIGHDGVLASANDYYLFLKALFNHKLVSQETLQLMVDSNIGGEGLGMQVILSQKGNGAKIGHDGSSFGGANSVNYYNKISTIMVVCSNFGDFFGGPLSETYREMVRELEAMMFDK